MLILPHVDLMLFYYFFATCETSSSKNWFALATGWVTTYPNGLSPTLRDATC